ncbi:MAG TPA: ankyrin repeat domain-containing protein [bacterium]|nr:ankyrin repeat domain-containing protein [bacterium]
MKNKIKTIIFNFITFSLLLTPTIYAAEDHADPQLLLDAAKNGKFEELQKLIEGGMNPNTADSEGKTLLILATYHSPTRSHVDRLPNRNHFAIVKYLLEREGINPDSQINEGVLQGKTALIFASVKGLDDIAKLLLKHNAKTDLRDGDGTTALMWASENRNDKMVELLLEHDAKPNLQDNEGNTALMEASSQGYKNIVKLLLKYNAKTDLRDKDGKTALDRTTNRRIQKMIRREN